ncbi:MAG: helix-turn-helix transcriptional regulator [Opitutae bacterium]|nr:helix-turn-helix transcriptional regulator [Opitutae bacterium]
MTAHPGGTMRIFEQAPRPALRPLVASFLVVEFPVRHRDAHLPATGPVAAFSFQGGCRLDGERWAPRAAFTGLRETMRTHEHDAGHRVLLARFTPVGAAAFLRAPLDEFSGTTADLADILERPGELAGLHERLAGARNHGRRVGLLEDFLLARISRSAPDPLVAAAVAWVERSGGAGRIAELTRHIGLSQSALERRFRRSVGITPKKFASLVRLRRAVQLRAGGADFTTVALAAGYFDQAHLTNDFRRATGRTPQAFFRPAPAGRDAEIFQAAAAALR